jgi:O-antigen/teichoic acid export membrane protein
MPAIVLTSGFRGVLEAMHAFGLINLIRLPMGVFTFLGPLVVVKYGQPRLDLIAAVLATGRIVACIVHAWFAWRNMPEQRGQLAFERGLLKPLCVSGGWLTLSNVISPFMGYVDRFVIGGIVSAVAVSYYVTPQEIVTKLWIIPGALTAVLFPTFAAQVARQDPQAKRLYNNAIFWIFLSLLPLTSCLALFSHEILGEWISAEFAAKSAPILQLFSVGILVNCLAHVPFTLIQSAGAPRVTALVHLVELPFFLAALWWLTTIYGVLGAAISWLLRMVFDTIIMFFLCNSLLRWPLKEIVSLRVLSFTLLGAVVFLGILFQQWTSRAFWLAGTVVAVALMWLLSIRQRHPSCS